MIALHTTTPWSIDKYDAVMANGKQVATNGFSIICGAGVAKEEAKANAEFIVRACNAYDKDQETIGDLVKALQDIENCCNESAFDRDYLSRQTEMRGIANAALSKVGAA